MHEFNFIHHNMAWTPDEDLFFQHESDDERASTISFGDGTTMAHIMHEAGLFPSVGQARKNGWDKPVPQGWTDMIVGKREKQRRVCILNEF